MNFFKEKILLKYHDNIDEIFNNILKYNDEQKEIELAFNNKDFKKFDTSFNDYSCFSRAIIISQMLDFKYNDLIYSNKLYLTLCYIIKKIMINIKDDFDCYSNFFYFPRRSQYLENFFSMCEILVQLTQYKINEEINKKYNFLPESEMFEKNLVTNFGFNEINKNQSIKLIKIISIEKNLPILIFHSIINYSETENKKIFKLNDVDYIIIKFNHHNSDDYTICDKHSLYDNQNCFVLKTIFNNFTIGNVKLLNLLKIPTAKEQLKVLEKDNFFSSLDKFTEYDALIEHFTLYNLGEIRKKYSQLEKLKNHTNEFPKFLEIK